MVTINLRFTNIYSLMSPAMMVPNPKKVTKIKKAYPLVAVTVVDTEKHTTEIINA